MKKSFNAICIFVFVAAVLSAFMFVFSFFKEDKKLFSEDNPNNFTEKIECEV